ncbi:MAG: tetratricopeptide repeat protein [Balneola sp.]
MNISNLIEELKRRNVFKVATAYAIAGWLIIQIVATVSPQLGFPEWVPSFFTVLVLIGFPLSLIFAWAFELTPEGLKKSQEVDITESVTSRTGKKLNGIIITILSMGVIFLLVERVFFAEAAFIENQSDLADVKTASIAVLPFVNMSDDKSNEYFSDGLSEELLNGLAKLEDVQVAGRTSSFQFKGTNPDLRDVGTQLGVKHILEGSVRKSGNRVRITAQLIQADNGFHLWSETYDRELTANEVFDIQEEITRMVVKELKIRLLPEEETVLDERPTQDIEAYNAYLAATQLEVSGELEDLQKAVEKYKEAIRLDPSFSLAYARLAYVYGDLNWKGNLSLEDMKDLMRENIDRALLIDGNEGKAYEALGYYYLNIEDNQKALETYERAIELLPGDSEVLVGYHDVLHEFSRHQDSHKILEKAYQIDPLNPEIAAHLGGHYVNLGDPEKGLVLYEKVLERYPDYKDVKQRKAWALSGIGVGELGQAFINMYQLYKSDSENVDLIVALHNMSESLGLEKFQEHMITRMGDLYPNNQQYYFMYANYYSEHGKIDEVLEFVDSQRGIFSDNFNKEIDTFKSRLIYMKGEKEKALDMYIEINPIVMQDEIVFANNDEAMDVAGYLSYATGIGLNKEELYKKLTNIYCDYRYELYEEAEIEAIRKYREWDVAECEFYKGNIDRFLELIRKQYFEYKIAGGFPPYFKYSRNMNSLNGIPEYEKLKEEILADIDIMKKEAIDYLKSTGDWKEEWEVEN